VYKYERSNSWTITMSLPQEFNVVLNKLFSEEYYLSKGKIFGSLSLIVV